MILSITIIILQLAIIKKLYAKEELIDLLKNLPHFKLVQGYSNNGFMTTKYFLVITVPKKRFFIRVFTKNHYKVI